MKINVNTYPNSSGHTAPKLKAPHNACDAHIHIYDARFPCNSGMVDHATVAHYRQMQQRLGTTRTVVVNPRAAGTDNRVTLDAITQLGVEHARGVAVVTPAITDAELHALHTGGIRGIRFTLYTPENAPTTFEMVEPLAERIHALGWHVQLHWTADQIAEHAALLLRLPCTIVLDHLARIPQPAGIHHPAVAIVKKLLDAGRTWIKLSGAYLDSAVGTSHAPSSPYTNAYADTDAIARTWVKAAPERMVWGSDWPHPTEQHKPDDAALMDLLTRWAADAATRQRILADNPAALYGFSA